MSGNKIFVDTNILLYFLSGDKTLAAFLDDKQIYLSFITQLELLGYNELKKADQMLIEELLSQCTIIDINVKIKEEVIKLKRKYRLKLPDTIIMATSIFLDIPIITADTDYKKVKELTLIHYER